MANPFPHMSDLKKDRIKELTEQGLSSRAIATRLGLSVQAVYKYQVAHGLREIKNPKKGR